jgi:RimJ/RimL family protein N-acetyltransferase
MSVGLLFGSDDDVAARVFAQYGQHHKIDNALGIISNNEMVGAVLFHNWNGHNIEVSYYGKGTLTAGILRMIGRYIIYTFNPTRVTVVTSKRNKRLVRSLQRLGFKLEGSQRLYYGKNDCARNTAIRFVMFRERVEQIALLSKKKAA